jgi:hypothetical protein
MRRLVRIKTWDQMEKEFGLDIVDNINCKYGFTSDMEKALPEDRIIVLDEEEWVIEGNDWNWGISDDIIEEEIDSSYYPQYLM